MPDSAPAHQLLGYALLAQGYASEAIPHLATFARQDCAGNCANPDRAIARSGGESAGRAGRASQRSGPSLLPWARQRIAGETIDRYSAGAYPDSARAHQAMAENYFVLRRMPDAEKEYREALRLRPGLPEAHLALGEVYAGASQWAKAEEEFRHAGQVAAGQRRSRVSSWAKRCWNKAKRMRRAQNLCVPTVCCRRCRRPSIRWGKRLRSMATRLLPRKRGPNLLSD